MHFEESSDFLRSHYAVNHERQPISATAWRGVMASDARIFELVDHLG